MKLLACLLLAAATPAVSSATPITFDFSDATIGPPLIGFGQSINQVVDGLEITVDIGNLGSIGPDATVFQFAGGGPFNVGISIDDAVTGDDVSFVLESIDFGNTFDAADTVITGFDTSGVVAFAESTPSNTANDLLETTTIVSDAELSFFQVAFAGSDFPAISNVVISLPIPEPLSGSLVLVGASLLATVRRR